MVIGNTSKGNFEWDNPVVRRGEIYEFTIKEELFPKNEKQTKEIKIHMMVNGSPISKNKISYNSTKVSKFMWNLKFAGKVNEEYSYRLETPSDCEPGQYKLAAMHLGRMLETKSFLILFNPWNSNDEVYMPQETDREEYILNPKTMVFYGSRGSIGGNEWSVDQFSRPTIETLIFLLRKIPKPLRSSAFLLARELTALVNNIDDNGILVGRWDSNYSDGKSPSFWSGSKAIFEKYNKDKRPVKYGQCFTFAAVLCSLFRLVGIGCRVITCFDCLHDSDDTLDMEVYYDNEFNRIKDLTVDSIWNFHCWTEIYMECPGVEKYNGWHVCDATPQEASNDGRYTCGPAPVAAIKAGDLKIGHDARYIFSEVNGDVIHKKIVDGKKKVFRVDNSRIGHRISTKAIGSNMRNDISDNYKYKDGSLMDVMARLNADGKVGDSTPKLDVIRIETTNKKDHIIMGEDLNAIVDIFRPSENTLDVVIKCHIFQHPNILLKEIFTQKINLKTTDENKCSFKVNATDILRMIKTDLCSVIVEVFVTDGDSLFKQELCLSIITPSFDIILPEKVTVGESFEVCVHMKNPLPTDLLNVKVLLKIDFSDKKQKTHIQRVAKDAPVDATFNVAPNKKGFHEVRAIIYGHNIPIFHEIKSINIV